MRNQTLQQTANQTYYLLCKKGASVGEGTYLGPDPQGQNSLVVDSQQARRFASLEDAEREAAALRDELGELEIEVRNAAVPIS
jgi:hypothetical protein